MKPLDTYTTGIPGPDLYRCPRCTVVLPLRGAERHEVECRTSREPAFPHLQGLKLWIDE